jgi:hypothetical protein
MKKIVLLVMGLIFLIGSVPAYQVNIDTPDSLAVGKPLVVTGTTTFGIGTPIDVVLYFQLTTTTEIKRQIVYVNSDRTFKTVFDTTDLKPGMYKIEVPANGNSDSVTMRLIQLYDRSDEILLESSTSQPFSGKLSLTGTIKGDENSGIQVEVRDQDEHVIFGPQYVNTNYLGYFSTDIPITSPGEYAVSFTDSKGFIGTLTITSVGTLTPVVTLAGTTQPKTVVSAHTKASRDNPVYFIVKTNSMPVTLYTSSSVDWVMEYFDNNGVLHVQNDQGAASPEKVTIPGAGKTIYVKIYPYRYSDNSEVFLYAENANSVSVSSTVPAPFAASAPQTPTGTQSAPLLPVLGFVACGIAGCILRR